MVSMEKAKTDPVAEGTLALLLIAFAVFAAGWLIYQAATTQKFQPFDAKIEERIKATE